MALHMSAAFAFHPRVWAVTFPAHSRVSVDLSERETASPARCCVTQKGSRAKYDPQSGHDPESAEHRPAQPLISLYADLAAGPLRTKAFGEELPGNVLTHGHIGERRGGGAGEQLPPSRASRQCPDAAGVSENLEPDGRPGLGLEWGVGEGKGPYEDVEGRTQPATHVQAGRSDCLPDLLLVQPSLGVLAPKVEPVERALLAGPGHSEARRSIRVQRGQVGVELRLGEIEQAH